MLILFLLSVFFCIYTYALFPVWLAFRANKRPVAPLMTNVQKSSWPNVSIIIAAHNEEGFLRAKLASVAKLDYPADRLQVVVISDGSSDATVEILQETQVTTEHYTPARGKPTAINRGLALATGEFVVFMDARQQISSNALKSLIGHFDDPAIGVVSGELVLLESDNTEAENVGLYWRYEKWIRQNESRLFSTTGATGALYACRKTDVPNLSADALLDDVEIPIHSLAQGKRTILEPSAIAYEVKQSNAREEFKRKVRTLAGNFQILDRHRWLLSPASNPVCWQFVSHKVFRLLAPLAMLIAFISSALGSGIFLQLMFALQIIFYLLGIVGMLVPSLSSSRIINLIKVFLQLKSAVVVGAYRYYTGTYNVRWKSD